MEYATITLNPCIDKTMWFHGSFCSDALNRAYQTTFHAGGKGINVSRALREMGHKNTAMGYLGTGCFSKIYTEMLAEEGISTEHFTRTAADTRVCIKMIDDNGVCTEANDAGGPVIIDEFASLLTRVREYVRMYRADAVVIASGSTPEGSRHATYAEIGKICHRYKTRFVLDTSGISLKYGILVPPFLVKTNLWELCEYHEVSIDTYKGKENIWKVVELAKRTASAKEHKTRVLCTLGADGAVYSDGEESYYVEAPKVECRGFAGAGDTFLAAYIHEFDRIGSVKDALRFAASAAAAKVEREGTAMPTEYEMWARFDGIEVKEM